MTEAKNKIFITGAGSGIGKACALLFLSRGWFVAGTDIDLASLSYLKESHPEQSFIAAMDVSNVEQVRKVFEDYQSEHNYLNILLNNAGILQMGLFENIALEDHLKTIQVNFSGPVTCTYLALELLKKAPSSRVINISSSSAVHGIPDFSVYSATKNALSAITEALNIELKKDSIHVCDIQPLFVNTPLLKGPYQGQSMKMLGTHLSPEDVADTVWKASLKNKLHWSIGIKQKVMNFVLALMPFAKHAIFSQGMPKQ